MRILRFIGRLAIHHILFSPTNIFNTGDYILRKCFCLLSDAYQTNAKRQVHCIELKSPLTT